MTKRERADEAQIYRLQPVFRKCFRISEKTLFALNDCIAGLGDRTPE